MESQITDIKDKQEHRMSDIREKTDQSQSKQEDELLRIEEKQRKVNEEQPKMVEKQDPTASTSTTVDDTNIDGSLFHNPKYAMPGNPILVDIGVNCETYNMNHKRRGLAIIFNHVCFKNMTTRTGSIKDCEDLKKALTDLDFEVKEHPNLTTEMVAKVLKQTAAEDHTDADCLVVVVMSHGESGYIHSFDFKYQAEMLWTNFTGEKCTTLIGKPKLFFIQACRGERLDHGVEVHERDGVSSYTIPNHADILIANSTYDGFYSWRNPDEGSWFIQALCQELEKNGRFRDLLTIMTFVNRRVALDFQSHVPHNKNFDKKKQVPSFTSMLTRLVYFFEKPQ